MNTVVFVLSLSCVVLLVLWILFKSSWCRIAFFIAGFFCLSMIVVWRLEMGTELVLDVENSKDVEGVYVLNKNQSAKLLSRMGYFDFNGRITLFSGGYFSATQIPACIIHGYDESVYSYEGIGSSVYGGYYDASGSWCIVKKSDGCFVRLCIKNALLNKSLDCVKIPLPNRIRLNNSLMVNHRLLKNGDMFILEFLIFNGDFETIYFFKSEHAGKVDGQM